MAASSSEFTRPPIVETILGAPCPESNGASPVTQLQGSDDWGRAIDSLLDIRLLKDDWDGFGAKAPPAELVDSAIRLAQILRSRGIEAPVRVVAGLDGTVLLEWQPAGWYVEIEVTASHQGEVTTKQGSQPAMLQALQW